MKNEPWWFNDDRVCWRWDDIENTFATVWPNVTINALVSCIIGLKEKFQPSITLIATGVTFSTNAKLRCCTISLLMKHGDALELKSAWVHTIVDLPPLIVMGNKKQDVGSENKARLF